MTATELIEEIKRLPEQERAHVYAFMRENRDGTKPATQVRYVSDEQFQAAADQVFATHGALLKRLAQ